MKVSSIFKKDIHLEENRKPKVYFANSWFNENKAKASDLGFKILKQFDIDIFNPRFDSPQIGKNPTDDERKKNFESNLEAIKNADVVFASTEGLDSGTIWECGYASALGIPVFGFAPLLPEGIPFNLMLAESMEQVFTDSESLEQYLANGIKPDRIGAN
jgi:nucleoside 2-deoxyribosyltransferase